MKKAILALLLITSLPACSHKVDIGVGVEYTKVPDLPPSLSKKAERLPDITDKSFGGIMIDSTKTDMLYNDVANDKNNLIDLYNCVKESINNKKKIKC